MAPLSRLQGTVKNHQRSTGFIQLEEWIMIDESTGMTAGVRYEIEKRERVEPFSGFFLDGKYYLAPKLQTAIGWLEGNRFMYDELTPEGEPVYEDRLVGTIENLQLTMTDGLTLKLRAIANM
jgi:hypothetical protein